MPGLRYSGELVAQVSFTVVLTVHFTILTTGPISTNLDTEHSFKMKGIQIFAKGGPHYSPPKR